jgi:hypothetical protein
VDSVWKEYLRERRIFSKNQEENNSELDPNHDPTQDKILSIWILVEKMDPDKILI